ncbi:MAG: hypothetical protein AAF378_23590 [Cyanobacteria bacterium P01_A01_bin.84]
MTKENFSCFPYTFTATTSENKIMNKNTLQTLNLKELKAYSIEHQIYIKGDLRKRASYINAIESYWNAKGYTESIAKINDFKKIAFTQKKSFTCLLPNLIKENSTDSDECWVFNSVQFDRNVFKNPEYILKKKELITPTEKNFSIHSIAFTIASFIVACFWASLRIGIAGLHLFKWILPKLDTLLNWIMNEIVFWVIFLFGSSDSEMEKVI